MCKPTVLQYLKPFEHTYLAFLVLYQSQKVASTLTILQVVKRCVELSLIYMNYL